MSHNAQKVNFTIIDETPLSTTNRLYNISGNLYFNGLALATGGIAAGTLADNTLRWSGSAWIETSNWQVDVDKLRGVVTNNASNILIAIAPVSGAASGDLQLQFFDNNIFSALDFNTTTASLSSNNLLGTTNIINFGSLSDIVLTRNNGINSSTLTITPTLILGPNYISSSYIRVGTTIDTTAGNIRYTGTHFEGRVGAAWKRFDSIPDGTVTNSTIHWSGTEWLEATNIKNAGTSTSTALFDTSGITIANTAAANSVLLTNFIAGASTGQMLISYQDNTHTAQLQFSASNAQLRSQNPAATKYHQWTFSGSGNTNILEANDTAASKNSKLTLDVSSNASFDLRNTHGTITKFLNTDQTATTMTMKYIDSAVGGLNAALTFTGSTKFLTLLNTTAGGESYFGTTSTTLFGLSQMFYVGPSSINNQIQLDSAGVNISSATQAVRINSSAATNAAFTNSVVIGGSSAVTVAKANTVYIPASKVDHLVNITSTPYTTLNSDYEILSNVAGASAITLIATPESGRRVKIKNINATGVITITPTSGNIDGVATAIIPAQYGSLELMSDGTNWFSISRLNPNVISTANNSIQLRSGIITQVTLISATYTTLSSDYYIEGTGGGAFTVNLIASPETGRTYIFKRSGAGVMTLDPAGSTTIDGSATTSVGPSGASMTIIFSGTEWKII